MSLSSYRLVLSNRQAALRVSRSRPSPPAYHHRLHRLLRGLKTACLVSLCPFVVKCCCLLLLYRLYLRCQYNKCHNFELFVEFGVIVEVRNILAVVQKRIDIYAS